MPSIQLPEDLRHLPLVPFEGTTTGAGNVGGTTVVDANAAGLLARQVVGLTLMIRYDTQATWEISQVVGFAAGTYTVSPAYSAQVPAGVEYALVASAYSALFGATLPFVTWKHEALIETPPNLGAAIYTTNVQLAYLLGGGIPQIAEITGGTVSIFRFRNGVDPNWNIIVNAAAAGVGIGLVFYNYDFPVASWQAGDLFLILHQGVQVTRAGIAVSLPNCYKWGRIL